MTDQNQDEMIADVDENEIVSEASMSDDPKNAEKASVDGVAKAADITKKQQPTPFPSHDLIGCQTSARLRMRCVETPGRARY